MSKKSNNLRNRVRRLNNKFKRRYGEKGRILIFDIANLPEGADLSKFIKEWNYYSRFNAIPVIESK